MDRYVSAKTTSMPTVARSAQPRFVARYATAKYAATSASSTTPVARSANPARKTHASHPK